MPFIYWWYGYVPKKLYQGLIISLGKLYHYFSVPYLLKHLFAPWKKDVSTAPARSIEELFKAAVFNLIPRVIGFFIRSGTIICGLILVILAFFFGIIIIICWLAMPLIIATLIFLAAWQLVNNGNYEIAT